MDQLAEQIKNCSEKKLPLLSGYLRKARQYLFDSTEKAQDYATRWLWHYNIERSNMRLREITPQQKLAMAA